MQIECLEHQTRVILSAGFTLDRSRRFDDPKAAYHPWSNDAPGTGLRAEEDFICRGVASPAIQPVTDLNAFALAYIGGGTTTAQANPPPRPPEPPPPAPEPRPTQPGALAPYYSTSSTKDAATLIDLAHATRNGQVVSFPLMLLNTQPDHNPAADLYWIDATEEIDCAGHRSRTSIRALLSLDRQYSAPSPNLSFEPWSPIQPDTGDSDVEALVCQGKQLGVISPVYDLAAFQRQYFAWAVGGQTAQAAVPPRPPPPPEPRPTMPPKPAALAPYYETSSSKDEAGLIDAAHVTRKGQVASASELILKTTPYAGTDFYWLETTDEFDCANHRTRTAPRALLSLDRRTSVPAPDQSFDAWKPITPDTGNADLEALVCHGQAGGALSPVDDLASYQQQYFAWAAKQ